MANWREIGVDNFRAALVLFDSGHYRSCTSRFYYAAFCILTHDLLGQGVGPDFRDGRETPGHAQLPRLVEVHFARFTPERRGNLVSYVVDLYRARIVADYSRQRVDRQAATKTFRATEKVFRYLEVNYERR